MVRPRERAFFFWRSIMRICGRLLRPSTLVERRLLLGHFGVSSLRVPRSQNIFAVARRIERYLKRNDDIVFLKKLATPMGRPVPPIAPDMDSPEPMTGDDYATAAE
ncbi:MAG: hypothetical protein BGO98_44930 [Myxococcales bacterium 68-20]|nr:MAG: hypothetical protein BGO98_44930 [Myxococcales bacterium 68-20]